jgi:hypothetical protein
VGGTLIHVRYCSLWQVLTKNGRYVKLSELVEFREIIYESCRAISAPIC